MSRTSLLLSTSAFAAMLAIGGVLFFSPGQNSVDVSFNRGHAPSILFLPSLPRAEERIQRFPQPDGSAIDQVKMRDGSTKRIIYDTSMQLRQVFAYYKAAEGEEVGPLMYEKTHDASGHLARERHLRLDGTLAMDGVFNPDLTYTRHNYFAAADLPPSALQAGGGKTPPQIIASVQTFDKWWHPTQEVDFRPDQTRKTLHTWGDGLDEKLTNYADDGVKIISDVVTGRGKYYTALYYPDGVNIAVEALNTYEGTTYQWYRVDHSLKAKLTYNPSHQDKVVIADEAGKPLIEQTWGLDYSAPKVDDKYQMRVVSINHFNGEGKIDIRYDYDYSTGKLSMVTYYLGSEMFGARKQYTVGADGLTTKVETYDDDGKSDGGKPVTDDHKQFVLEKWMTTYPHLDVPPLKEGLNLYGQNYMIWGR